MKQAITRRDLIKCGTAAGAALAGMSILGCSSAQSNTGEGDRASAGQAESAYESRVTETIDADVAVVGAGMSGLAAAVSAAENGASVVVLEANTKSGGNGMGTDGVFAIGSDMQKELDIQISKAEILKSEGDFFNWKVDMAFWSDLVDNSGDNIAWLMDHDVSFSGTVDDMSPLGHYRTQHTWGEKHGAKGENYAIPMTTAAESLGVQFRYESRGRELVLSDGTVAGVYAESPDGVIKVNANAVILATGGWTDNPDMMQRYGVDPDRYVPYTVVQTHMGDGLTMALAAGARENASEIAYLCETTVPGIEFASTPSVFYFSQSSLVWVNQDAKRYADESCLLTTSALMSNAFRSQEAAFAVFSDSVLEAIGEPFSSAILESFGTSNEALYSAATIAELAGKMGVDAATLEKTVSDYNGYCETGVDEEFAKNPAMMVKLEGENFYATRLSCFYGTSSGGLDTTLDFQVLDGQGQPIQGLFAVGADSCKLYYGTYTIFVPSSFNGNNVNSGRVAGKKAASL